MRRFGIYVLNIVFLFAFAVAVEVSNPGGATEAVGYGVAFLALLLAAVLGHVLVSRHAGPRGLNAYKVIMSGAAFLALAGLSGNPAWGVLAALQMLVSLAAARRKAPAVEWDYAAASAGVAKARTAYDEMSDPDGEMRYRRMPDGSFVPVNPSAPRSRQVH